MEYVTYPHEDALVIIAKIDWYNVKQVLIDSGSSTDVLFLDALKKMENLEKYLKNVNFLLIEFASNTT